MSDTNYLTKISSIISITSIGVIGGMVLGIKSIKEYVKPTEPQTIEEILPEVSQTKFDIVGAICDEIKLSGRLELCKGLVTNTIVVGSESDSFLFKNKKYINVIGLNKYTIDLNNVTEKNIKVSGDNIIIYLKEPEMECELLPDKFTFQEEKGVLAFYDVKLTPEQYNYVIEKAKENCIQAGKSKDYNDMVKNIAEESVNSLVRKLTADNNYTIKLEFI